MPSVAKDFKGNKDAVVSTVARIKSLNLMKILPQWSLYSSLVDTCLFLVHALELRWLTFKEYGTRIFLTQHARISCTLQSSSFSISLSLFFFFFSIYISVES
ncbi:hypothetical protein Peur_036223 [Populus x canadensis]